MSAFVVELAFPKVHSLLTGVQWVQDKGFSPSGP